MPARRQESEKDSRIGPLLALAASLSWGFADFFGPLKGRTLGALRVLFVAQVAGLLAIGIAVAVRGKGPAGAEVLLAVPASLSGTLGLFAFYRGMAVGAMSIVAPIAGVSAAVPVAVGLATGDRPSAGQIIGIVLALFGVVLASREHQDGRTRVAAGTGLALLAAIGFGGYFVPMHYAGRADFWWASLTFRATSFALIALAVAVARARVRLSRSDVVFVALIGIGDTLGNFLFAAASGHGLVSVTSVLASLYPIVTIVLARAVLSERVDRSQQAGIAATLAGVVLISSA